MQMSRVSYEGNKTLRKEEGNELKARKAAGVTGNLSPGEFRLPDSWRLY